MPGQRARTLLLPYPTATAATQVERWRSAGGFAGIEDVRRNPRALESTPLAPPAARPSRTIVSRSSWFWTMTRCSSPRSASASSRRSSGRNIRARSDSELNTKPSPATALTILAQAGAPGREAAEDHGFEGHVVGEVRPNLPVHPQNLAPRPPMVERRCCPTAARREAAPRNRRRGLAPRRLNPAGNHDPVPGPTAASACASRCDTKYQSSVTRNSRRGRSGGTLDLSGQG